MISNIAKRVQVGVAYRLREVNKRCGPSRWPTVAKLPWGVTMLAWPDFLGKFLRSRKDNGLLSFEISEQRFLLRFIKPGMTVLDVGAHDGLYTLLAASQVGKNGKIIAFEPSSRERGRLKFNLFLNGCNWVEVIPMAVGEEPGTVELFVCQGYETGCNSLRPPTVPDATLVEKVPLTTIDLQLEQRGVKKIDLVKMDIEGAELSALKGGSVLFREIRPVFMIELEDIRCEPWGITCKELYRFVAQHDYTWFELAEDGRLKPTQEVEYFSANLVAVPKERLAAVLGEHGA